MSSKVVIKDKPQSGNYSRVVQSLKDLAGQIPAEPDGLYGQRVIFSTPDLSIDSDNLDLEFTVPFDDDTEANEAVITVYNLSNESVNTLAYGKRVGIQAGYGKDIGVIFNGYISKVKTKWEDCDKVTQIWAIDNNGKKETELTNVSYASGTQASTILKKLCEMLGLPIAKFVTKRDHTYKDKVAISGGLMQNIKKYAEICGVLAYVNKSRVYVCPLSDISVDTFDLTPETGLISASEFEEETQAEEFKDRITGQEIEMLLQHRITTGSTINLTSRNASGDYRVREGTHTYDGDQMITKVKAVSYSCIKK